MTFERPDQSPVEPLHQVLDNPLRPCPREILQRQVALEVLYKGFDAKVHCGIMEIDKELAADVAAFFDLAFALDFPVQKVVAASDPAYQWDDDKLMADNASSGFNYRPIAGSDRLSPHARGRAFDINTRLNPYVRYQDEQVIVAPPGATWDPLIPGTLYGGHPLVEFMKSRGWEWGGDWLPEEGRVDYQHFQRT